MRSYPPFLLLWIMLALEQKGGHASCHFCHIPEQPAHAVPDKECGWPLNRTGCGYVCSNGEVQASDLAFSGDQISLHAIKQTWRWHDLRPLNRFPEPGNFSSPQ